MESQVDRNNPIALTANPMGGASCYLCLESGYEEMDQFHFRLKRGDKTYYKTFSGNKIVTPCEIVIAGPDVKGNDLKGWSTEAPTEQ